MLSSQSKKKWRQRRGTIKILTVLTSRDQLGNTGRKTGFCLEEFAAPYLFSGCGVKSAHRPALPKWQTGFQTVIKALKPPDVWHLCGV
jgi:hypothetical protein